jgi:hypothetical protein
VAGATTEDSTNCSRNAQKAGLAKAAKESTLGKSMLYSEKKLEGIPA